VESRIYFVGLQGRLRTDNDTHYNRYKLRRNRAKRVESDAKKTQVKAFLKFDDTYIDLASPLFDTGHATKVKALVVSTISSTPMKSTHILCVPKPANSLFPPAWRMRETSHYLICICLSPNRKIFRGTPVESNVLRLWRRHSLVRIALRLLSVVPVQQASVRNKQRIKTNEGIRTHLKPVCDIHPSR
jgi:hypothetical protein